MDNFSPILKFFAKPTATTFVVAILLIASTLALPHSRSGTSEDIGKPRPAISERPKTHPNFHLLPSLEDCGYVLPPPPSNNQDQEGNSSAAAGEVPHLHRRVKRLVGGDPAGPGNYPWMVQIMLRNTTNDSQSLRCGGTIINNHTILTAAHCFTKITAGLAMTHVVLGSYKYEKFQHPTSYMACHKPTIKDEKNLAESNAYKCSNVFHAEIDDVIIHEDYVESIYKNDLALVRLRSSIAIFNTTTEVGEGAGFIRPVCLPRSSNILDGQLYEKFEALGWGYVNMHTETKQMAEKLNRLRLTLHERDYCSDFYGPLYGEVDESKLCALGRPEQDVCNGDSGGPLEKGFPIPELQNQTQVFQVGVVSSGGYDADDCGRQGVPTMFTNVVHLMPWILDNLKP